MKFIKDLIGNTAINETYLCKSKNLATAKNGSNYYNLTLMDKTGTIDAKIWDINSDLINDFNVGDFITIEGTITTFNEKLQINITSTNIATDYDAENYFPKTEKNINELCDKLHRLINSVSNDNLNTLLKAFFENDKILDKFKRGSAAKSIHHAYIGGLLEHSINVATICEQQCILYSDILNYDLLITAALLHDIGKIKELSDFPANDYTDEGKLLGHIYMGCEMITLKAKNIPNFSKVLLTELKHCILAHHGELEYGSPKKPDLIEAIVLHNSDNMDAKIQIFKEKLNKTDDYNWLGFDRFLDSDIRRTYGQ